MVLLWFGDLVFMVWWFLCCGWVNCVLLWGLVCYGLGVIQLLLVWGDCGFWLCGFCGFAVDLNDCVLVFRVCLF